MFICYIGKHPSKPGEKKILVTTEMREVVYTTKDNGEGKEIGRGLQIVKQIAVCAEHAAQLNFTE